MNQHSQSHLVLAREAKKVNKWLLVRCQRDKEGRTEKLDKRYDYHVTKGTKRRESS